MRLALPAAIQQLSDFRKLRFDFLELSRRQLYLPARVGDLHRFSPLAEFEPLQFLYSAKGEDYPPERRENPGPGDDVRIVIGRSEYCSVPDAPLVCRGNFHVLAVLRYRAASDVDALGFEQGGDLFVGERLCAVLFLDHLLHLAFQEQKRSGPA